MTRLLIAGATGLVGNRVLELALADPRIDYVIALTRRPIALRNGMENVVINFADMPPNADFWSVDAVICALGTTRGQSQSQSIYRTVDHDYPLAVARHARSHGATRLGQVSSLGADPRSRFAYTRTKGELERDLMALGYPSLTIVRPSVLDGHRDHTRFAERMAGSLLKALVPIVPRKWRISPANAVAACLIEGVIEAPPGIHLKTNENMI